MTSTEYTAKPKRDLGKGLDQAKVEDVVEHWKIEGYDVYPWSSWEGTHTSRGVNITGVSVQDCPVGTEIAEGVVWLGDGTVQVRNLSAARGWIRKQVGK
jgi:hypothetical protein